MLDEHGSCPFLNSDKLCEIYIRLGAESLCTICSEHPRYYEWFNGFKEGGIGLCCEEAARIILTQTLPFSTYTLDIPETDVTKQGISQTTATTNEDSLDNLEETTIEYSDEIFSYLFNAREKILSYTSNSAIPLKSRICNILWYSYTIQQNLDSNLLDDEEIFDVKSYTEPDFLSILNFFASLEPNNDSSLNYFKKYIDSYGSQIHEMDKFEKEHAEIEKYLENIAIYFIWRYFLKGVFDYDVLSKVKFTSVSVAIIRFLFFCKWKEKGDLSLNDCILISKKFSEEMEYSEDNMFAFAETSYDEEFLFTENLLGL